MSLDDLPVDTNQSLLNEQSLDYLHSAAKWARVKAIIFIVASILLLVTFVSMIFPIFTLENSNGRAQVMGSAVSVLVIALVLLLSGLLQSRFAAKQLQVRSSGSPELMQEALRNLSCYQRFTAWAVVLVCVLLFLGVTLSIISDAGGAYRTVH